MQGQPPEDHCGKPGQKTYYHDLGPFIRKNKNWNIRKKMFSHGGLKAYTLWFLLF